MKLHVLAEKRNGELGEICPYIDKLYLYDQGIDLLRLFRNKYDLVIDTEQWHRLSALIAYLSGINYKIGFATNQRAKLYTFRVDYSQQDYEAESFLNLAEQAIKQFSAGEERNLAGAK